MMPFWSLCCESEAILSKMFRSVTRAGMFIRENFHLGYLEISASASHINTSRFLRMVEWRDEISETEPARLTGLMKKPLDLRIFWHVYRKNRI